MEGDLSAWSLVESHAAVFLRKSTGKLSRAKGWRHLLNLLWWQNSKVALSQNGKISDHFSFSDNESDSGGRVYTSISLLALWFSGCLIDTVYPRIKWNWSRGVGVYGGGDYVDGTPCFNCTHPGAFSLGRAIFRLRLHQLPGITKSFAPAPMHLYFANRVRDIQKTHRAWWWPSGKCIKSCKITCKPHSS